VLPGVTAWTCVVPRQSFVDACAATHVMPIGVAVASQDVDKSGSDSTHAEWQWHLSRHRNRFAILREGFGVEGMYAEVASFESTAACGK
jgi:hypothetical protein